MSENENPNLNLAKTTIEDFLGEIEDILEESKSTLSGEKIKVDRKAIMQVIADIRNQMPEEIKRARKIATQRREIIDQATALAEERIALANKEAAHLTEETEIIKKARAGAVDIIAQAKSQSDEIIEQARNEALAIKENAEKWARDLRAGASDFADRVLNDCDELLSAGMDSLNISIRNIRTTRESLKREIAKH